MAPDALDSALASVLGKVPDDWQFQGVRPDGETPPGWQAMAWRPRDNAWAVAQGPTFGAAVAALVSGDLRVIPSLDAEHVEPPVHPTVDILIDGEPTPIDQEIAPLVEAIGAAGLVTISTCQCGLDGRAVIDFDTVDDASMFLAIAAQDFSLDVESLWNRIFVENEPDEWQHFRRERIWKLSASTQDYSVEYDTDDDGDEVLVRKAHPAIGFHMGVAFPPSDIPTLTELVRRYAAEEPPEDSSRDNGT